MIRVILRFEGQISEVLISEMMVGTVSKIEGPPRQDSQSSWCSRSQ